MKTEAELNELLRQHAAAEAEREAEKKRAQDALDVAGLAITCDDCIGKAIDLSGPTYCAQCLEDKTTWACAECSISSDSSEDMYCEVCYRSQESDIDGFINQVKLILCLHPDWSLDQVFYRAKRDLSL